jgi:hypothetical protein
MPEITIRNVKVPIPKQTETLFAAYRQEYTQHWIPRGRPPLWAIVRIGIHFEAGTNSGDRALSERVC